MIKRGLVRTGGALVYVGAPIAIASTYWDLFVHSDGGTQVSFITVVILILSTPIISRALKNIRTKFNFNIAWLIVYVAVKLLKPIMEPLEMIALFGFGGSIAGELLFKVADKMKVKASNEKQAVLVAERMKELSNV